MAKREKKVVYSGITGERMDQAFGEYASADARLSKINATMDEAITKIRERYSDEISRLNELKESAFEVIQAFAVENKEELFNRKKSMETVHGLIGFRTGTPKLKTLKGFTWGAVTNLLKEFLPGYVRVTEEPAKDKLLADREEIDDVVLSRCGVAVAQDETFFVELKKEEND